MWDIIPVWWWRPHPLNPLPQWGRGKYEKRDCAALYLAFNDAQEFKSFL
jgi:hypothetical protein